MPLPIYRMTEGGMPEDDLMKAIAAAQRAPLQNYLLWAELGDGEPVALRTVQMPLSVSTEVSLSRLKTFGRDSLATAGIVGPDADVAHYHLDRLPSADELKAELDPLVASGQELALLDFTAWEAAKSVLHLSAGASQFGNDPELDYKGVKLRRSAVS